MFCPVDCEGDMLNLAFLQYYFSEGEHTLKYTPHGNSQSSEPYIRTMPSMLCKVKEKARETTAKCALKYLSNEAGGILDLHRTPHSSTGMSPFFLVYGRTPCLPTALDFMNPIPSMKQH